MSVLAGHEKAESVEALLDLARANAQALIITTTEYLSQAGIPLEGWSCYLGAAFANSWDLTAAGDPSAFLEAVLTSYKAIGARVHSVTYEDGRAEAVISGFPNEGLCQELGADCSLATAYNDVAADIAERLGLTWWWGTSDGLTTLVTTVGD
ncbi:MAG: hypothetical protein KC438_15705 [Thermomicrobiales bacterium]|nr:hypothetical protein [Thermomicrobiales bacterium]MCO5221948.1 hypothetical protein [Thermomicrobiales bacterium]